MGIELSVLDNMNSCDASPKQGHAYPQVPFDTSQRLDFWVNTGTTCNFSCEDCFMDGNPRNDVFGYIGWTDLKDHVVAANALFPGNNKPRYWLTGGEPSLSPHFMELLLTLPIKNEVHVLSNGYRTLLSKIPSIVEQSKNFPVNESIHFRISLDDYEKRLHEQYRKKKGSWDVAISTMLHLKDAGFPVSVAVRDTAYRAHPDVGNCKDELETRFRDVLCARGLDIPVHVFEKMLESGHTNTAGKDTNRTIHLTDACFDRSVYDNAPCSTNRLLAKVTGVYGERKNASNDVWVFPCSMIYLSGSGRSRETPKQFVERYAIGQSLVKSLKMSTPLNHTQCYGCIKTGFSCVDNSSNS